MADIFLSYASQDRDKIKPLVDLFGENGWSVWWDRNLVAGPSFEQTIEAELDAAHCVVVAWSQHSIESRWCRAEATEGLERDILVPLRLDDTRLPLAFRASQTASFVNWPESPGDLDSLLAGLRSLLGAGSRIERDATPSAGGIRIGEWQIHVSDMLVARDNKVVHLTPLSWSVLMHLVSNRDRIVNTQELLDNYWRGEISDASAVRKAIHEIRQAFEDDPRSPTYIQTIPRKGYRLLADTDTGEAATAHAVAVLPFVAMTQQPEDLSLTDGIAEEILSELSRRTSIPVIARSSSFQFRQTTQDTRHVGQRIGATHIVEGSVRRVDDQLRVTAQLVAADSGLMLWSGRYESNIRNLFRLQDEVAREVAGAVQTQLGYQAFSQRNNGRSELTNKKALDCYLQANALLQAGNPLQLRRCIELFHKATDEDPGYLSAWLALAHAYLLQSDEYVASATLSDVIPQTESAIRKVLEHDPNNGSALGIRAWIATIGRYDFERGLKLFERAVSLAPNDAWVAAKYAFVLNALGDPRAEAMYQQAYKLDPLAPSQLFSYAIFRLFRGEESEAVRLVESLISDEQHRYDAHMQVGLLNAFVGRFQVARHHLNRAREIVGMDYPGIKVLEYYVELNKDIANPDILNEKLDVIERISRSRPAPLLVTMGWPEQHVESIWRRAIKARQTTVVMYACRSKPTQMSDAFWEEVQSIVGVRDYLKGSDNYMRPAVDRAALVASQADLSGEVLNRYVGNYVDNSEGDSGALPVTVERRGRELWITFPDTGDYYQLIPTGTDHFEFFSFFRQLDFNSDGKRITGFSDVSELATRHYARVD